MIALEQEKKQFGAVATIKVIGIGGAGGNTVNSIIDAGVDGFECIVANTDSQALENSKAPNKIQIGIKSTKGLGTGANPEVGQRAAEEDLDKVMDTIGDADIVFIAAGMGGGTGSGGAPVIARACREKGILSIAVVTKPFTFEGRRREAVAEQAITDLRKEVDTLIIIPNQKLLEVVDQNVSMIDAFDMINEVLGQSVRGISDIITKPGHINVDFADVRTIMRDRGMAVMGTGRASGPERARKAAEQAISSPLLENISIQGAHGVLLNITGGKNLGLHEISEAASVIYDQVHEEANIILGSVIDTNLEDEVVVTIIATGCATGECADGIEERVVCATEDTSVDADQDPALSAVASAKEDDQPQVQVEVEDQSAEEVSYTVKHEQLDMSTQIDMNDLDVPTFMRKQVRSEDVSE